MDEELIGRRDEQAQLQARVTEALAGRGSLVLLGGEAGVGKTTLVQHSLAASQLQVLEGFAVEGGTPPFGPVVEALRSYLRAGEVPLLAGPLASHLAMLLPELGTPSAAIDRATLFEAIRQALVTVAARRPTAVFLDDLQWADDATPELLGALARSVDCYPLLLLAAFRTDELPRGHPIRAARSRSQRKAVGTNPWDSRTVAASSGVRPNRWCSFLCTRTRLGSRGERAPRRRSVRA